MNRNILQVGFCLERDLRAHGVHCDVVAPSSVPSPRGSTNRETQDS